MNKKVGAGLFQDIIGHQAVIRFLEASLNYQTVSHAYLFIGPRGVGKTAVLTRFLSGLIGGARADLDAFLTYPDFTLVRRGADEKTGKLKKNITVEQIREMRGRLAMGSFLNSWKIAVVDGAEDLSAEASNAFLKTLEEPTRKTVIVLIASSLVGIPETIASRCQVVRFRLVGESDIKSGLEGMGVAKNAAKIWAAASGGRPGVAIRLALDVEGRAGYEQTVAEGITLMTSPLHKRLTAIGGIIPEKAGTVEVAGMLEEKLIVWETLVRDGMVCSLGLPEQMMSDRVEIKTWSGNRKPAEAAAILRLLGEVRRALKENVNPRLAVERLAIAL